MKMPESWGKGTRFIWYAGIAIWIGVVCYGVYNADGNIFDSPGEVKSE